MSRKDTDLYFTTVIADSPDLAFFGGHLYLEGAEPSLTRISMLKGGQWFHIYDIDDVVYAACKRAAQYPGDRGNLCFLGRRGFFREHPRGKQPIDTPLKSRIGYFYALKEIGQQLYAAGTQNQLFRHDGQAWVDADQGLYSPLQEQVSATDVYKRQVSSWARDERRLVGDADSAERAFDNLASERFPLTIAYISERLEDSARRDVDSACGAFLRARVPALDLERLWVARASTPADRNTPT